MDNETIQKMTPEEYQEYLKTIDPDSMGFEGETEGVVEDDNK